MADYWETRFKNEGAMWKSDSSDSLRISLSYP
jgi:hypothetical protein